MLNSSKNLKAKGCYTVLKIGMLVHGACNIFGFDYYILIIMVKIYSSIQLILLGIH